MFELSPDAGLWGLFAAAFMAATVLPGGSEVVLIALITKYPDLYWTAIAVATLGNTLGGMTSYALGRLVPNRVMKTTKSRAIDWLNKYGQWALLMSWVPLIGDALCVAAGWLRFNIWTSLAMLAVGKFIRYVAVAGGWAWFSATFLN